MAKEASALTLACRELFGKNIEITYREALPILQKKGFDLVSPPSRDAMKYLKAKKNGTVADLGWEADRLNGVLAEIKGQHAKTLVNNYKQFKTEENSFNVNKYIFKNAPERAPISEKPAKKAKKKRVSSDMPEPARKLRRGKVGRPRKVVAEVEMTVEEAIAFAKQAGGVSELVKSVSDNTAKIAELEQAIAKAKAVVDKLNSVKDDLKSAA